MLRIAFAAAALSIAAISWGAEPALDNDRVTVWDTTQVLPPAQHDFVAVPLSTGALQTTTADGKSTVSEYKFGDMRFNGRDRTHTEVLVRGTEHAVITELK